VPGGAASRWSCGRVSGTLRHPRKHPPDLRRTRAELRVEVRTSRVCPAQRCESRAYRKPTLWLRFAGVLLLRDPPRITRLPV